MNMDMAVVEFISASTAGVVDVELGFVPDFVEVIIAHGGTNPSRLTWFNNAKFSAWAAALHLLLTGSTGVVTRVTAGITKYDGGESITTTETADSAPKHVNRDGTAASGTSTNPYITKAGIAIPAASQVNSGRNVVIAFRADQ